MVVVGLVKRLRAGMKELQEDGGQVKDDVNNSEDPSGSHVSPQNPINMTSTIVFLNNPLLPFPVREGFKIIKKQSP